MIAAVRDLSDEAIAKIELQPFQTRHVLDLQVRVSGEQAPLRQDEHDAVPGVLSEHRHG